MPASFQQILNSRIFKFIIGEEIDGKATEFFVHEDAVAQLSPSLRALMKGEMEEAQMGCTIWEDVSKETFERFAQFAYTGDYTVPEARKRIVVEKGSTTNDSTPAVSLSNLNEVSAVPSEKKVEEPTIATISEDVLGEVGIGLGSSSSSKKMKMKKLKKGKSIRKPSFFEDDEPPPIEPPVEIPAEEPTSPSPISRREKYPYFPGPRLVVDFKDLGYPLLAPLNNYEHTTSSTLTFDQIFDPSLSCSCIFLAHASLFFLANYRQIDTLKSLTLHKLHTTLCAFRLTETNASDIVDLARYVYVQEGDVGGEIRNMVCQLMAMNAVVLCCSEGFMEVARGGGTVCAGFLQV
ncbi:hypothetical protein G7Y89_g3366 [Cudoniella acicularis]|uniref:BTB domain-containing protein n=1 Tax=Cudoniella acicularis TaxID=354080 RepID=A0A8H4W591_9HELO|nr:hypothetical protein G7Y89_g3366 [Cudoniella acicularis]